MRAPNVVYALDDLGREAQLQDLYVRRLPFASGRRAHRDTAPFGLADLPDEVAVVIGACRAPRATSRHFS